jgi:1,4-dihydroxy-2-naphthoate octaprenyltransferase
VKKAEYLTVLKSDPRFQQLLEGKTEDGRVALPIKSFAGKRPSNWATFQLLQKAEEKAPATAVVILKGIRPSYLTMTLTSPFLCTAEMARQGVWPGGLLWASILLSLTFLHFSLFLFNDYKDHLDEVDLNQSKRKRGIIQLGWATAREVKMWAFVNFSLGAVCAIPALYKAPIFVFGMGGIVVLTFFAVWKLHSLLGKRGLNEYVVSLSLGPLLAFGFSCTVYGEFTWFSLCICIVFGWLASLVFQTKYLEEMVATYLNRRESLIAQLGFDKSKRFITYQLIGLPLLSLAVGVYFDEMLVAFVLTVLLLIFSRYVVSQFQAAQSPMSSQLVHLSRKTAAFHLAVGVLSAAILFWS